MAVGPVVVRVAAVGFAFVVGVHRRVRVDQFARAVRFLVVGALGAVRLQARAGLCADADAVALFDVLHIGPDADGGADNFVAHDAGCS